MEGGSNIISIDNLCIGYSAGRRSGILLPPLSGCAVKGEMVAVIGRNGIGKSTLLKSLTGSIAPLGGSIKISQKKIEDYSRSELARKIGYISTESVKVTNMKVYDLVALGRYQHTNWIGTIDQTSNESILRAMQIAGISHLKERFITELSDGERQRTMIAMVLAQDTDILIMDEPTAYLDVAGRYEMIHLMQELTRHGKTIIFSTHDFNIAVSQSDKIWLILESGLVEGAPEDLIMDGHLGKLFEASPVKFDPADGSFSFRTDKERSIYSEGDSAGRFWFEKALIRTGFGISSSKTDPFIRFSENIAGCELVSHNKVISCRSVYELTAYLKR